VEHAFVVHGAGGLDEISLAGETLVAEIQHGAVRRFAIAPEDFGVKRAPLDAVRGGTAEENAATIREILNGKDGAQRDIVVTNAAAALVAAGIAKDFREGARLAGEALDSGKAREKLASLVKFTRD
jgi:anthranilate phosphoribosyltransferase